MNRTTKVVGVIVSLGAGLLWTFGCSGGGSSGSGFDAGGEKRVVSGTLTSQDTAAALNTPIPGTLVTISTEVNNEFFQSQDVTDANGFFEFQIVVPETLAEVTLDFDGAIGDKSVLGQVAVPVATELNGIGVTMIWTENTGVVLGDIDLFEVEDDKNDSSSAANSSDAGFDSDSQNSSAASNSEPGSGDGDQSSSGAGNSSGASSTSESSSSSTMNPSSASSSSSVGPGAGGSISSTSSADSSATSSSSFSFAPPNGGSSSSSSSDEPTCGPTESVHGNGNSGQSEVHAIEKATENAEDKVAGECGSLAGAEILSTTVTESSFDGSRWHATVDIEFCCYS